MGASSERRAPALSIVLVTDGREAIERELESLAAQTASNELEVVLVVPAGEGLRVMPSSTAVYASFQVVELPSIVPLNEARAAGVIQATAPVVVVGETHAYPDPEWAAALIDAHRGPWVGVVPTIRNGNPEGAISWSNFLLTYGPWMWQTAAVEVEKVPEQNTAFKRDVLLGYGEYLAYMLGTGSGLSADLRSKGHRFVLDPAASIRHANVSRGSTWLRERFVGGRAFGATRAVLWPVWRRLAYAAGFPLIAPMFLIRSLRATRWPSWQKDAPALTLPAVVLGVVGWALGEALGYAVGIGRAEGRMAEYEINRQRYMAPSR